MRPVASICGVGLALMVLGCAAILSGSGHWQQFNAPHGIAFNGPSDLQRGPALGDGGLLAAYGCPRYYFEISWASYGAVAVGETWSRAPKREVELGEGYGEPWPCGAALHVKWEWPGATRTAHTDTVQGFQHGSHVIFTTGGDYRVLHFSGGCKTRRDRDELVKVFRSVRFKPW